MSDARGALGLILGLTATAGCGDNGSSASASDSITTVSGGPSTAGTDSSAGPASDAGSASATQGSSATDSPTSSATQSSDSATSSPTSSSTGDVKFDLGDAADIPGGNLCDDPNDPECVCNAVDILFIVDNSGSMDQHKPAVVAAFDPFVDEMIGVLPVGTSVHVGVTRATGFYDPGNGSSWGNGCEFMGDGNWYPPDMGNNATNGQQGRLYEQSGQRFFELETGQDPGALKVWFEATLAGAIAGEQHSNTETVVAGAAYPFHPVNATYNAGFMREQAVLVLFLLSDAPDMSPKNVPTQDFIAIVSDAKANCGDMCILTTGAIASGCYDSPGITNTRLYDFMNGFGQPPASFVEFGFNDTPDFTGVLGAALSEVIATTCENIPPIPR